MAEPPSKPALPPARSAGAAAMPRSWLAGQGRLPLAFMGLALVWLLAATTLLVVDPALL